MGLVLGFLMTAMTRLSKPISRVFFFVVVTSCVVLLLLLRSDNAQPTEPISFGYLRRVEPNFLFWATNHTDKPVRIDFTAMEVYDVGKWWYSRFSLHMPPIYLNHHESDTGLLPADALRKAGRQRVHAIAFERRLGLRAFLDRVRQLPSQLWLRLQGKTTVNLNPFVGETITVPLGKVVCEEFSPEQIQE